jgi:hypothetical protein
MQDQAQPIFGAANPASDGPQIKALTVTEDDYFLPEGGLAAKERFLAILGDPRLTQAYISAYGFTLQPMFDAIIAADARGVSFDIILDHSQSTGTAEAPLVANLVKTLKNSHITISTAGVGSGKPSSIYHWKAMVLLQKEGDPVCWEGSTNFSGGGWDQGNTARVFTSSIWAQAFIDKFLTHKSWARTNEPQYQDKGLAAHAPGALGGTSNAVPLNDPRLVYYGPHPCQKCDPLGKKGTLIVKAGNGAPEYLEFDYPNKMVDVSHRENWFYPNSPKGEQVHWVRHEHLV